MALPTINKNEGNTRSVGVRPFQRECISGANGVALPGVLTIIIKQTTMPRKTSRDKKRDVGLLLVKKLFIFNKFIVRSYRLPQWLNDYFRSSFIKLILPLIVIIISILPLAGSLSVFSVTFTMGAELPL